MLTRGRWSPAKGRRSAVPRLQPIGNRPPGELKAGEHAEYTLLQRKLAEHDLSDTTLFTTLEPCTTRNHPKRACADWIIERKVRRVVMGMLDPNPVVYEKDVARLRAAGVDVDYFPKKWRDALEFENAAFIEQFHASPALQGRASFNFTHNNGVYLIGHGELLFQTRWSNASGTAIHMYVDRNRGLGLALSARSFAEIRDASVYDMTSRYQTPREGEYIVFQNGSGHFAAVCVEDVKARSHGDAYDSVTIAYRINGDGGPRFTQ